MQRQQFINKLTQAVANTHRLTGRRTQTYFVIIGRGNNKRFTRKPKQNSPGFGFLNLFSRPPKTWSRTNKTKNKNKKQ